MRFVLVLLCACYLRPLAETEDDVLDEVDVGPDFDVGSDLPALSLVQGETGVVSVAVARNSEVDGGAIAVTLEGAPAGVTGSGTISAVASSGELSVSAASSTVAGSYVLIARLTSTNTTRTVNVSLTVTPAVLFSLTPPTNVTVAMGSAATATLGITRVADGEITFEVAGAPAEMTVAVDASGEIMLAATYLAAPGTSMLTVTGTLGVSQPVSITFPVTVTPAREIVARVVNRYDRPTSNIRVAIDGVIGTTDAQGETHIVIPKLATQTYTAVVYSTNAVVKWTTVYDGLASASPIFRDFDQAPQPADTRYLSYTFRSLTSGDVVSIPTTASGQWTKPFVFYRITSGSTLVSEGGQAQSYDAGQLPWAASNLAAAPFLPLIHTGFPAFSLDLMGVYVELEKSSDGSQTGAVSPTGFGNRPRSYPRYGNCAMNVTASFATSFSTGFPGETENHECAWPTLDMPANANEGIGMYDGSGGNGAVAVNVSEPTSGGYVLANRFLYLQAFGRSSTQQVVLDTASGGAPFSVSYVVPNVAGLDTYVKVKIRKGSDGLYWTQRIGATLPTVTMPEAPTLTAPASATDLHLGDTFSVDTHGFEGVFQFSAHPFRCFTGTSSCTLPSWIATTAPASWLPPPGTGVQARAYGTQRFSTLDAAASLAMPVDGFTEAAFDQPLEISSESNFANVTFQN